jgi:hypothetical protein
MSFSHSTAPARNHKNSDLRSEYETRELQSRLQPITELSQRKQTRGEEECRMWKLHKSHSMTAEVLPERMAKEHGRTHVCAVLNVQFQPFPLLCARVLDAHTVQMDLRLCATHYVHRHGA